MCAVDKLTTAGDQPFMDLFGIQSQPPIGPMDRTHYPMRARLIVHNLESSPERIIEDANWGLIPFWAKEIKIGRNAFNARSDSLAADKPMFRAAFKYRRCLLPATGYIEYRAEDGRKVPYFFTIDGGKPYAYAGLWELWERDDSHILSCSMITCEPNALASEYHTRMPVILDHSDYDAWLDPKTSRQDLMLLLAPFDDSRMSVERAG